MTQDLVSVIIPLYNAAEFVGETIESVLAQTYKKWELIIVDDCSTDHSVDVVKFYSQKYSKIRLIESENNAGGPATPRNIGMQNAEGEFIAFLDADDIWDSMKLEVQVDFMKKQEEIFIIGTNAETFPERYKNKLYLRKDVHISLDYLLKTNKFITSSVLIRSEFVSTLGYFDEDKRAVAVEDYDYWLRFLMYKSDCGYVINKPLVKYRIHSQNISLNKEKSGIGHYDRLIYIYKKYPAFFSIDKIKELEENKEYLNLLRAVKDAYHRGQLSTFQIINKNEIQMYDRFMLVAKKIILNLVKQKVRT